MIEYINLSGVWRLEGYGDIKIPGTTDEAKYKNTDMEITFRHLHRPYPWLGEAVYTREVEIPKLDNTDRVYLEIERTKAIKVYVDGVFVAEGTNMLTTQLCELTGKLCKGSHTITVSVNNDLTQCSEYPDQIAKAHQFTDHTQTNWNGMLGNVRIVIKRGLWAEIGNVWVKDNKSFDLLINSSAEEARVKVFLDGNLYKEEQCGFENGSVKITVPFCGDEIFWNEHNPYLYDIKVVVSDGKNEFEATKKQGFRYIAVDGKRILVNGERVFFRGKHDACIFPLTGYAPMDTEEWIRIFGIAKSYGINHYRCHTWVPPRAALEAADICGIYFQVELPLFGSKLYKDTEIYEFAKREAIKVLDEFAHHPSFVLLSLGNELSGDRNAFNEIIDMMKAYRDDVLYTQGSNNFLMHQYPVESEDVFVANKIVIGNDIYNLRNSFAHCDMPLGHFQSKDDNGTHNFYSAVDVEKPILTHEISEFQFFPDFDEINKYTGVTRAENLKLYKERMKKNNLEGYDKLFAKTSGHISVLGYRDDIETTMKSDEMSGFQLLDLQDFSGQGTALVGVLDAFMDSKGIIAPEKWREFCAPTVIIADFNKFVYRKGETFKADIYFHNYGNSHIDDNLCVKLGNEVKNIKVFSEKSSTKCVAQVVFENLDAGVLNLELSVGDVHNSYELYVYDKPHYSDVKMIYSKELTDEVIAENEKIILFTSDMDAGVEGFFASDFWCWPMFETINGKMGRHSAGTLGLCINNNHKAFDNFETQIYSDYRWKEIVNYSRSVILDGTDIEPVVRNVDNMARNHSIGFLFELCVESCKILVCASDLVGLSAKNPAASNLLASLQNYVVSDDFCPDTHISYDALNTMLKTPAQRISDGDFSMFFAGDSEEE